MTPPETMPGWRLRLVGPLVIAAGPRHLAGSEVGSRKARTLLALLAVHSGQSVPVDRIVEALWGDAWPAQPAANVATLVSRLRSALDPAVVVGGRPGYRLGAQVRVDLWDVVETIAVAETTLTIDPARALSSARDAVRLLAEADVFADEPGASWAEPARLARIDGLRRARHVVATAALARHQLRTAKAAAQAAALEDPFDEVACRLLMQAHASAGEPARALAAFERLRVTLADDLGIDPSAATMALHVAILRDPAPTLIADLGPVAGPMATGTPGASGATGRRYQPARPAAREPSARPADH